MLNGFVALLSKVAVEGFPKSVWGELVAAVVGEVREMGEMGTGPTSLELRRASTNSSLRSEIEPVPISRILKPVPISSFPLNLIMRCVV